MELLANWHAATWHCKKPGTGCAEHSGNLKKLSLCFFTERRTEVRKRQKWHKRPWLMNKLFLCRSEVIVSDTFGCQLFLYTFQITSIWVAEAATIATYRKHVTDLRYENTELLDT